MGFPGRFPAHCHATNSRDSEQPLWIVPTTGGSALRVGAVLAHDATWMPNGDSILFASGNKLGIANLDAGTEITYIWSVGTNAQPRLTRLTDGPLRFVASRLQAESGGTSERSLRPSLRWRDC